MPKCWIVYATPGAQLAGELSPAFGSFGNAENSRAEGCARSAVFGSFGNAENSRAEAWSWRSWMRGRGGEGARVSAVRQFR
jgi:hypothetical protein